MDEISSLEIISEPKPTGPEHPRVVKSSLIQDPNRHDPSDTYHPPAQPDIDSVRTVPDLVRLLQTHDNVDIEARVYAVQEGKAMPFRVGKEGFLEAYKRNESLHSFRESVDWFGTYDVNSSAGMGIGHDYTPLLGGPFAKQLYYSYDYLQMHSQAFYAINHDPVLRSAVDIICNFVLGKGFRVDCDNPDGLIVWRAFEKTNKLQRMIRTFLREMLTYGENMIWWLPDGLTELRYKVPKEQASQHGLIPRIRLQDPSSFWEIITFPEDIESKIAYVQIFPTQYQTFTDKSGGKPVPSTKFIYQQIPASQIEHYKMNCMSNEKRGRSLLFPVLGYAKRLRDTVNYSIIALQKQAAWTIDTKIDGNQSDIDNYYSQLQAQGQFAPAGSEFVHSTKVERQFLSANAGKGGQSDSFHWCLDMICAGLGIPVNYLGTSAGQSQSSRAGSLVATEPVAKRMEEYQAFLEDVIHDMADRLFKMFGINADVEVTFPEIITQDRTTKLKDLSMAESMGWIAPSRAAEIAAKEFNITNYDWEVEKARIEKERTADDAQNYMPLTMPAAMPLPGQPGVSQLAKPEQAQGPGVSNVAPQKNDSTTAITSDEKKGIKDALRR